MLSVSSPSERIPDLSTKMIFLAPRDNKKWQIAVPAAPTPLITILTSSSFLCTTFKAFDRAAPTTTAVPC